jgi:hypothetical protein
MKTAEAQKQLLVWLSAAKLGYGAGIFSAILVSVISGTGPQTGLT